MQCRNAIALAMFLGLATASAAGAQARTTTARIDLPHTIRPAPPIGRDSAKVLLLAHLHNATIVSERLMLREKRQVYSFRVREKGKPETVRVLIDATTGALSR